MYINIPLSVSENVPITFPLPVNFSLPPIPLLPMTMPSTLMTATSFYFSSMVFLSLVWPVFMSAFSYSPVMFIVSFILFWYMYSTVIWDTILVC